MWSVRSVEKMAFQESISYIQIRVSFFISFLQRFVMFLNSFSFVYLSAQDIPGSAGKLTFNLIRW